MRLPTTAQTEHPWRIHELVEDFILEDVWALPTPGGPDDFPRLVGGAIEMDPGQSSAVVEGSSPCAGGSAACSAGTTTARASASGCRAARPPARRSARTARARVRRAALPPLYLLDDELAAEIANRTVHGVMHLAGSRRTTAATAGRWPST